MNQPGEAIRRLLQPSRQLSVDCPSLCERLLAGLLPALQTLAALDDLSRSVKKWVVAHPAVQQQRSQRQYQDWRIVRILCLFLQLFQYKCGCSVR